MDAVQQISAQDARKLLSGPLPPRLIDVREQREWALARVEGAELLPLSQWPGIVGESLKDPEEALVLICHHGVRSASAASHLITLGFKRVFNLRGGIDAWTREVDPSVPLY